MYADAKKIHLIEEILKIETDDALIAVEEVLKAYNSKAASRKSFKDFAGILTQEEAEKLELIIEQGCETIHTDDWK
jgi:hypothetical protein